MMKPMLRAVIALFMLLQTGAADEPKVTLEQGQQSVKVLIGEDVFTVYRYGTDRRKPFFLPVTGPGGYELLQQAVASQPEGALGRKVFVASETAAVESKTTKDAKVHYGEVLDVGKVDGNRLWIPSLDGWVQRRDIAPLAAIVVRLINDEPESREKVDKYHGDHYDHPHHKGIWFSVDEIDEIHFWVEKSVVLNQSVKILPSKGKNASLHLVNHWMNFDNEPILVESTTVTFTPDRLLAYDATLSPAKDEIHIGDTKEGMFAVRLPGPMREKAGGGPVTTSEGVKTAKAAWGKPARWIDYNGPIDGHMFGVTVMDSTRNPWPSRYHVRDYGLFAVNPFGAGAYTRNTDDPQPPHARTLKKGESLHFSFGAWIHGPDVDKARIEKVYEQFVDIK